MPAETPLLDESKILQTLLRLRDRIDERFPNSGLGRAAAQLLAEGKETAARVRYLGTPNWPIRIAVGTMIAAIVIVLLVIATTVGMPAGVAGLVGTLQAVETFINDLIFLGIAVFFLVNLEDRLKRRRALAALHRLRSLAHVVDMHQLTKDPERISSPTPDTASSPARTLSGPELGRYLDYCSEMLSIISKLAALHVQRFSDGVTLGAVNEVETLCSGLSGKIWQKITLLDRK